MANRHQKALLILSRSNDGDDLKPADLWLVQEAVNNRLSLAGWEAFEALYQRHLDKPLEMEEACAMININPRTGK